MRKRCSSCGAPLSTYLVGTCMLCRTKAYLSSTQTNELTPLRAVEIAVNERVKTYYNGVIPVQLRVTQNPVMVGAVFTASVPGQSRSVDVSAKDLKGLSFNDLVDKVAEEVLYAIFLLLDENDDVD